MPIAFALNPYVGAGPIRFGMSRAEVRQALGAWAAGVQEWPVLNTLYQDALPVDYFPELDLAVEYRHPDLCAAIVFFVSWGNYNPSSPTVKEPAYPPAES